MKILATVDYHGQTDAIATLERLISPKYDLVVIGGDLGFVSQEQIDLSGLDSSIQEKIEDRLPERGVSPVHFTTEVYDVLAEEEMPVIAIPGNSDLKEVHDVMGRRGTDLHDAVVTYGGVSFVGFGGVPEMPFAVNLPYQYTEDVINRRLEKLCDDIDEPWMLVTHVPPIDSELDETDEGIHAGSKSVRQIITTEQPEVALCGHIHEARGMTHIGETILVNPGPIMNGYVAEICINGDTAEVTLLDSQTPPE